LPFAIAQILIDKGADVNINFEDGFSPLDYAIENGHPETAILLIDKGAGSNGKTNVNDLLLSATYSLSGDVVNIIKHLGGCPRTAIFTLKIQLRIARLLKCSAKISMNVFDTHGT